MQRNMLNIFFTGLGIYLKNFFPLSRAMLFPVLGQIIGIILILGQAQFYRQNYLLTLSPVELQKNLTFILLGLILMVVPGFIIFLKAFWDYMVVMVSLNTMVSDIVEKKPAASFKIHNGAVKLRTKDYLVLLFILMGIWFLLLLMPFVLMIPAMKIFGQMFAIAVFAVSLLANLGILAIISVYLCLCFQIFAFEAISPVNIIKKSYEMIDNKNFWRAVLLGFILFVVTGAVLPAIFGEIIKNSPLLGYLVLPFESYANILLQNTNLIETIQQYGLTVADISREFALMSVGTAATMFVLPLGSACFTLFYLDLKEKKQ